MKIRRLFTKTVIAAGLASLMSASPASASLVGDGLQITVTHTGTAGGLVGPALVNHTYAGVPSSFTNGLFGTFLIASPAAAPGFDNAILVNFTTFNYTGFTGATGTIAIGDLAEDVAPGSIAIFAGAVGSGINIASAVIAESGSFAASWAANSILTPSPTTPDAMVVAWNSVAVPAPGAIALLGLAGLVGQSRRRRS